MKTNLKNILTIILLTLCFTSLGQTAQELGRANQSYAEKSWEQAFTLYTDITNQNPYYGKYWFRLGSINYELKNFSAAISNYKKAITTGFEIATSQYNIACAYALNEQPELALDWLKMALENGLRNSSRLLATDSDLNTLRASDRFIELMPPSLPETVERTKGWESDIKFMKSKFEESHYQLFTLVDESKWNSNFEKLIGSIDELNNFQIINRLMEIVASIGAGHSMVVPPFSGENQFKQMPLEFYRFSDGIYVRAAKNEYNEIVGKEVVSIEGMPIEKVLSKVKKVANPENEIMSDWTGLFYATLPEVLMQNGIIENLNQISIQIKNEDGKITSVNISSEPFSPQILQVRGTIEGWNSMNHDRAEKPLYQKNTNAKYWFEHLDNNVVYCQLNEIKNAKNQSLKEFGESLTSYIENNEVNGLVLDLRLNNGGNGLLNRDFLVQLIQCEKINQRGRFFTIIGRKSFSAATMLITQLDQYTETIFIGEPTGGKPSHIGDDNYFQLPYSGLMVSASTTYWQSHVSYDTRNWIAPEIYCALSSEDYLNNNDPCMNVVAELFEQSGPHKNANDEKKIKANVEVDTDVSVPKGVATSAISELANNGAIFDYNGKQISSKKAIEIAESTDFVVQRSHDSNKLIVFLSESTPNKSQIKKWSKKY